MSGGGRNQDWKNTGDVPEEKEHPLLFTVGKSIFCHRGVLMAKKFLYGVCHFELLEFFEGKRQNKAKPTENSRGTLFFEVVLMIIIIYSALL